MLVLGMELWGEGSARSVRPGSKAVGMDPSRLVLANMDADDRLYQLETEDLKPVFYV